MLMMKQFITRFIAVAIGLLFLIAVGIVVLSLYALTGMVALIRASHLRTTKARLRSRSNTLLTRQTQVASRVEESGQD